jgi:drug/metabolite transporter (DMT)-like permease
MSESETRADEAASTARATPRVSKGARAFADNPYLLLGLASLCWSGNHVAGRAMAGRAPPLGVSTVRWLLPALVLWFLAREHIRKDWPVLKQHWRIVLFLGLTGGALFSAGQYVGLQYTTALNVSVLNSLSPVMIIAAGALIFHERLHPVQVIGIATSLVGVLVIVARGDPSALAAFDFNWGDIIILFNMAVWAIYSVYLRLRPKVHWLSFTFVFAVISSLGTLPFAVGEYLAGLRFQPTLLTALLLLYVSIFPSVIAFAAWVRGVEIIGSNRASPFLHLVALYSALLAYVFLGERLHVFHVAGFALILAGVWCAARKPR